MTHPTPRTDAAEAEYRNPMALHGMDMKTVFGRMQRDALPALRLDCPAARWAMRLLRIQP